jgi:hypothetical protein
MMCNNHHERYISIASNVHYGYFFLLLGPLSLLGYALLLQRLPVTPQHWPLYCSGSPGPFNLYFINYLMTFPCWALLFVRPGHPSYFSSFLLIEIIADWILVTSHTQEVGDSLIIIFNATFYLIIWACLSTDHFTHDHFTHVPKRLRGWNSWCTSFTAATIRLPAFVWPIPQMKQRHYCYVQSATVPQVPERLQRLARPLPIHHLLSIYPQIKKRHERSVRSQEDSVPISTQSIDTPFDPQSIDTPFGPQSFDTPFGPQSFDTPFGPSFDILSYTNPIHQALNGTLSTDMPISQHLRLA